MKKQNEFIARGLIREDKFVRNLAMALEANEELCDWLCNPIDKPTNEQAISVVKKYLKRHSYDYVDGTINIVRIYFDRRFCWSIDFSYVGYQYANASGELSCVKHNDYNSPVEDNFDNTIFYNDDYINAYD